MIGFERLWMETPLRDKFCLFFSQSILGLGHFFNQKMSTSAVYSFARAEKESGEKLQVCASVSFPDLKVFPVKETD